MTYKVLIACEFSGTVRDAFLAQGFDAWSCDLLPDDKMSNRHIRDDVRNVLAMEHFDLLMVAHPPCTRLCNSGVRWLKEAPKSLKKSAHHYNAEEIEAYEHMNAEDRLKFMWHKLDEGAQLFSDLWNADVKHIAVENPVMHKHAKRKIENYEEFQQSIQPWQYGHNETKRTCLWLKNLPDLIPEVTEKPENIEHRIHMMPPSADRWKERSRFFTGIANAMADQWGRVLTSNAYA